MKLKQIHAEVWLGGILIILAVIFYIMAGQFPNTSAAVWPKAVLIGIMILSALLVIHGLQMTKDADGNADLGGAVLKGADGFSGYDCRLCGVHELYRILCIHSDLSSPGNGCSGTEKLEGDSGSDRWSGAVCLVPVCSTAAAENAIA